MAGGLREENERGLASLRADRGGAKQVSRRSAWREKDGSERWG